MVVHIHFPYHIWYTTPMIIGHLLRKPAGETLTKTKQEAIETPPPPILTLQTTNLSRIWSKISWLTIDQVVHIQFAYHIWYIKPTMMIEAMRWLMMNRCPYMTCLNVVHVRVTDAVHKVMSGCHGRASMKMMKSWTSWTEMCVGVCGWPDDGVCNGVVEPYSSVMDHWHGWCGTICGLALLMHETTRKSGDGWAQLVIELHTWHAEMDGSLLRWVVIVGHNYQSNTWESLVDSEEWVTVA